MPFYDRLSELRDRVKPELALLAVLPEPVEKASEFLAQNGVMADRVISSRRSAFSVSATPTLIVLDGSRVGAVQPAGLHLSGC